jgi:TatA/E family protein of Tat protein translocase
MNFLGMGPLEILLIVVLALIVFGPAKLPEIMGQVGRAIADFRRATGELSDEFNRTIQAELQETKAIVNDTTSTVTGAQASINAAITGTPAPVAAAAPALAAAPPGSANGSNGTNGLTGTNGTVSGTNGSAGSAAASTPQTPQWNWESSAPAPGQPAVTTSESSPATPGATSSPVVPPTPSVAQPPTTRKPARRDDLLPPY